MKTGVVRRRGEKEIIGTWSADQHSLVVETEDVELRRAADEILKTPQTIPVHAPERKALPFVQATPPALLSSF